MKMTAMIRMTMAISMDAPFGCDVKTEGRLERIDQQTVAHQLGNAVWAG